MTQARPARNPSVTQSASISAAKAAWFTLAAAVALAALMIGSRLGLPLPARAIAFALILVIAAAFSWFLLPESCAPAAKALAPLGVLLLVWPTARLAAELGFFVFLALAIVGLIRAHGALRAMGWRGALQGVVIAVAGASYWYRGFYETNHINAFSPELMALELLDSDNVMHASVAAMIASFGVPSQGIDGLTPLLYHYGTHAFFAGISRIAGVTPIESYMVGMIIVALPALFLGLLAACRRAGETGVFVSVALALLALGLIGDLGWRMHYHSESFAFSLAILLFALPLLQGALEGPDEAGIERAALLAGIVFVSLLLTVVKLTSAVTWCVIAGWVLVRRYGLFSPAALFSCASMAAALALGNFLFRGYSPDTAVADLSFLPFFREFGLRPVVPYLASVLLLVVVAAALGRLRSVAGIGAAIRDRSVLDVEAVAITLIVTLLPAAVLSLEGGAQIYFVAPVFWFSIAILLRRLPAGVAANAIVAGFDALWSRIPAWRRAVGAVLLAIAAYNFLPGLLFAIAAPVVAAASQVLSATAPKTSDAGPPRISRAASVFMATFARERRLFSADVVLALSELPTTRFLEHARSVQKGSNDLVIFVPPGNIGFWQRDRRCLEGAMAIPARTGIPVIFGLPPAMPACQSSYGLMRWAPAARSRPIADEDLCSHAKAKGFRRVLVYENWEQPRASRLIACI